MSSLLSCYSTYKLTFDAGQVSKYPWQSPQQGTVTDVQNLQSLPLLAVVSYHGNALVTEKQLAEVVEGVNNTGYTAILVKSRWK